MMHGSTNIKCNRYVRKDVPFLGFEMTDTVCTYEGQMPSVLEYNLSD